MKEKITYSTRTHNQATELLDMYKRMVYDLQAMPFSPHWESLSKEKSKLLVDLQDLIAYGLEAIKGKRTIPHMYSKHVKVVLREMEKAGKP